MFEYLLLGALLIAIICLIYWFFTSDRALRAGAKEELSLSAGTFDQHARRALNLLNRITAPTPDDHFQRGNILFHNVLGGREGMMPQNVDIINGAALAYRQAINDDPIMLHGVINFAELFEENMVAEGLMRFGNISLEPANKKSALAIANEAIENNDNRLDAVSEALDKAAVYTNDRQNVHDSSVNKDLSTVLNKFRVSVDAENALNEIEKFITKNKDEFGASANNALRVLNTARAGTYISTYNDTEDKILAYVWARCNDQRNRENRRLMREAVVCALADSVEKNNEVCINGRVSRVLNSLATIDFDPSISGAMTFEAYRNQAYNDVKGIINRQVEMAAESDDPVLKKAAENYDSGELLNSDADKKLNEIIISAIDANLESYKDVFSSTELEGVRAACHVFAAI